MPHSLRVKIKNLRYKGIITDKDCDRLCKALDNENVLDKIRAEIEDLRFGQPLRKLVVDECLEIIDKYKTKKVVREYETY